MFLFSREDLFLAWAIWLRLLVLRKHKGEWGEVEKIAWIAFLSTVITREETV
jgi:hypothetical protein